MRTLVYSFVVIFSVVYISTAVLEAQDSAPPYIPVQGYLTDDAGEPLDGTNDITFSTYPDNPQVNEPVVMFIRVHNNSPVPHNSIGIDLYVDDVLVKSFIENIPARTAEDEHGFVDISFDTSFSEDSFKDVKVVVDPANGVNEWNEDNNSARRALFIGDYLSAAEIFINLNSLGTYYPSSNVRSASRTIYRRC